jgi:aspartate racemase
MRDNFFDLGGESLLAVRLFAEIEELFHKKLPLATIFAAPTIEQLVDLLIQEASGERLAYAVPIRSSGEKPIFFVVGTGAPLHCLSSGLGPDQPLLNIGLKPEAPKQLTAPYRVEEIASHLRLAICENQPRGPYYLGGYCEDAAFAYEVARQLVTYGQTVGLLAMFEPRSRRRSGSARIGTGMRRMVIRINVNLRELRRVKTGEFPSYLRSRRDNLKWRLRRVVWRGSDHLPLLKHAASDGGVDQVNYLAANSYNPGPLGCPTVIFRSKDSAIGSAGDPYFGWRDLLTGPCETRDVPGDHRGIFSQSNVTVLAERLRDCLQEAQQKEGNL